jgi:hypothetical protein
MLVLVNGTILGSIRDIFVKHKFAIYSTAVFLFIYAVGHWLLFDQDQKI